MDLSHTRHIDADRETVWRALTDPEQLRSAIPGCESIERTGDDEYRVVMVAAIGPVKAKFTGKLALSEVVPPESYTITFEGQGGPAGFAKGVARVKLTPEDGGTRFDDTVTAQVGGRLAQAGQRLIDAAAGKLADEFFASLSSSLAARPGIVSNDGSPAPAATPKPRPYLSWGIAAVVLAAVLYLVLR